MKNKELNPKQEVPLVFLLARLWIPVSAFLFFLISLRCFEKAESSERIGWALASCIALSLSAFSAAQGTGALFVLCVLTLFGGNVKRRWWVGLLPTFTFIIWYLYLFLL